jgi:hypothetical protein
MNPIDDFFAFNADDYGSPIEKRKKKKKKVKTKNEATSANSSFTAKTETQIPEKGGMNQNKHNPTEGKFLHSKEHDKSTLKEDEKEDDVLTNLLGLSETPSFSDSASPMPATFTTSKSSGGSSGIQVVEEEDNFLESLNSYMSLVKKTGSETKDLLQAQKQEQIKINGKMVEANLINFEFHISIQAAGQISGFYDLQVKGSTKISKIINKLLPLFNNDANPQFPETLWPSLVMYIEDLNLILNSGLRCSALLAYKNQLKPSKNILGFEVTAMITILESAQMLQKIEKEKRLSKQTSSLDRESNDNEFVLFKVQIYDPQIRNSDDDAIIDLDDDSEDLQEKKPKIIEIEVDKSMPVSDLISLYKFKAKLPMELKVGLFLNDKNELESSKSLDLCEIKENDILTIKYNVNDVDDLRLETAFEDEDEDEDEGEDADLIIRRNEDLNKNEDSNEEYFTIFVVGKDKKRYKVDVKPSTKISDIAKYYLQKASLPETANVKLLFDDEDMDFNGTVADTELESEFMIDVVIN